MLLNVWLILTGLELALTVLLLALMFFPRFNRYIENPIHWRIALLANGWACFVMFVWVIKNPCTFLV